MSKSTIKFIRLSPTKARLIARQVQGMNAEFALATLEFTPNRGAKYISNAISSAVANGGFEPAEWMQVRCLRDFVRAPEEQRVKFANQLLTSPWKYQNQVRKRSYGTKS